MKKLLSVLISISIVLSTLVSFSLTAQAGDVIASGGCGAGGYNMSWTLDNEGTITISGNNQRMADFYTNSRPGWYNYRDQIKKLVVENGVINIGSYAFADCVNLVDISFGTIDTLGNNAFENCKSITTAYLPNGCNWIWQGSFKNCTSLLSVSINACYSYNASVPDDLFNGCSSLGVVKLGESITNFNQNCFNGCTSLSAIITEADSLAISNNNAFNNVNKSKCYIVSSKSGAKSFANNNGFAYTNEYSGVCSDNTYGTDKLQWHFDYDSHTLSFTGSGDMNFYQEGSQPWYKFLGAVNKISFANTDARTSTSTASFINAKGIKSVDLTNIYSIGWGCFQNCTNLGGRVEFDGCIAAIWGYAFENCGIDSITFKAPTDDHTLDIKAGAFKNCSRSTYWLNIPSNTKNIEEEAFFGTGFNYVTIESDSINIGTNAFGDGTGGYARFFGPGGKNNGVYDFVKSNRENNKYNWHYYCMADNHTYVTRTVYPTCTSKGYDVYYCQYCDADTRNDNFVSPLEHSYVVTREDVNEFVYYCSRCGKNNIRVAATDLIKLVKDAVSQTAGYTSFMQYNYNPVVDVNNDGVINARDYLLIMSVIKNFNVLNKKTTIDTSKVYQTIEGFGASAAWWSQYLGNWENADKILELLYSEENGIGLDIYRYNLGAGSRDINDSTMYIDDERTNCFLKADGTYDWNNDPSAMNALAYAQKANPNLKVTLFSNSAPVYMTNNGHAYANPVNEDGSFNANMSEANYQRFADFVATCAEHFIDEGYNVTEVSPINEPEWSWAGWINGDGGVSMNQEGCNWTSEEAVKFFNNYMVPTLMANPKLNGKVGVSIWESGQMDHWQYWTPFLKQSFSSASEFANNNANIRSYVDSVSTHSYWAGADSRSNVARQLGELAINKKVRCTEYCQMSNDGNSGVYGIIEKNGMSNGMEIEYGLAMADIIHQDLTMLNAVEWDWWVACGKGIYTDSLIYVNENNHADYQTSKRYYCMGNYSKFVDVGAKRVDVSTGSAFGKNLHTDTTYSWSDEWGSYTDKNNYIEQSAYLNPDGSVVVVYINNSDTNEYTSFDASQFTTFDTYVTDELRDLELSQSGYVGDVAVTIPSKSVTTVVLQKGDTPAKSADGAYLFSYFVGNGTEDQRIRFAVSDDGYNFTPLNANSPVITQAKGTLNCRDPYIFKGEDGYYYIIATDMDASTNEWWGNSKSMVLWRSKDLVNWTDETIIDMRSILPDNDINRCWAPQVIWDSNEQKYMVYFSLAAWPYTGNGTYLYYCYTDDLLNQSHYTKPELLYKPKDAGASIDGDIIYDAKSETYYLYYKDETKATICVVKSKSLTGPYSDSANPRKALNTDIGLEGCNSYFITGTDTLVMLADAYGDGYFVMNQSTDFEHFNSLKKEDYTINNCSPRHGSVIAISKQEKNNLVNKFGY